MPTHYLFIYAFIHSLLLYLLDGIYVLRITGLYCPYTVRYFKTDLQEVACEGMDWIILAQDREKWRALVNVAMDLRVP